jgi:hypothetical protein
MADELRHALAINLHRAGDALEDLARRAAGPEAVSRVEGIEESQAYGDAGAAICEAVSRGLLRVPKIASVIGDRVSNGYRGIGNGSQCANVFLEVMRKFLYPLGVGVFPHFGFQRKTYEAKEAGDKDCVQLQSLWRRHELQERATGCHLLARLVESGNDSQYRSEAERTELLASLADALRRYAAYFKKRGTTGGTAETDIIILVHQLRCYYDGQFPEEFTSLWDQFLFATTPYEEVPGLAFATTEAMLCWVEREMGWPADEGGDGASADGSTPGTSTSADPPIWDKDKRELRLDGKVVKSYRKAAQNQTLILASFEELNWPARIDSPFRAADFETKSSTIKALNEAIPQLRFWADGAHGIRWERKQ